MPMPTVQQQLDEVYARRRAVFRASANAPGSAAGSPGLIGGGQHPAPDERDHDRDRDRDRGTDRSQSHDLRHGHDRDAGNGLADPWALCLSGGGIRSATFALGVVQALAMCPALTPPSDDSAGGSGSVMDGIDAAGLGDAVVGDVPAPPQPGALYTSSLLSRFDYLSTVSGGGYVGSFIASLFIPGRLRKAQQQQQQEEQRSGERPAKANRPTLASKDAGAPRAPKVDHGSELEHDAHQARARAEAADAAIAALIADPPGRIRSSMRAEPDAWRHFPLAWLRENGRYLAPTGSGDLAYAVALSLRNLVAVQYVIGTLIATPLALMALLRALWSLAGGVGLPDRPDMDDGPGAIALWWSPIFELAMLPALLWTLPVGLAYWYSYRMSSVSRRDKLNKPLCFTGLIGLVLAALGVVESWTTPALEWSESAPRAILWFGSALVIVLSIFYYWAVKGRPDESEVDVALQRVALTRWLKNSFLVLAAFMAFAAVETAGQTLYWHWAQSGHGSGEVAGTLGLAGVIMWLTKVASNLLGDRGKIAWLQKLPVDMLAGAAGFVVFACVATAWSFAVQWVVWNGQDPAVDASDTLVPCAALFVGVLVLTLATSRFPGFINLSSLQSFYSARLSRAYLGASNGERLDARRDRKALTSAEPVYGDEVQLSDYLNKADGSPASFAPLHIVNVTMNKTVDPGEQLVQRDRKGQPLAVTPLGFAVDGTLARFESGTSASPISCTLPVSQWVGTSGAALSTGDGRQTSLGLSLLCGLANVRLGTWWESGVTSTQPSTSWFSWALPTQSYLLDEFTATFHGLRRRWHYLSDGGHFENTALYEALRPSRGVRLAVVVDSGADPRYEFNDLGGLIRLARIDYGLEVEPVSTTGDTLLDGVFARPEDVQAQGDRCAVLLWAHRGGCPSTLIVLIKPVVLHDAPEDVQQYARTHKEFPQQPTSDQFFDEAQWESYRRLGLANGRKVFDPVVWAALQRYAAQVRGAVSAKGPVQGQPTGDSKR